uniref:Uncharacterized protein n=1 Tax=Leersia perrieri TaxID=77586 RepID=A0A0D9W744_9ORYZ
MNLKCCNYISQLPQVIEFLANLRHLELPCMDLWNVYMPCGISELTNLQTIHAIKFRSDSGSCGIADLVKLDNLRGEDCFSNIGDSKVQAWILGSNGMKLRLQISLVSNI